jgi:peptide chain release factor 1
MILALSTDNASFSHSTVLRRLFQVLKKLARINKRYQELNQLMSDAQVSSKPDEYKLLAVEHAELSELADLYQRYSKTLEEITDSQDLLSCGDSEMEDLAREELTLLEEVQGNLEDLIRLLLVPVDPMDKKNVILEIRAGTGGEEACLFAAALFRMYTKYAENQSWRTELMNQNLTGRGGIKEVIAQVEGKGAYSKFKYESGTHRVQRVPETEASGRVHTSAVTVAILPEAEDVDVIIKPEELRIDVFRSTGPGGQSVNTTDSAVRITHIPTGTTVSCQDEKSQHKNKAKALKVLRARILDSLQQEQQDERARERKQQVGSGDRSERIRTYNFPQNRLTDHRINLTLYRLDSILEGDMDELVRNLSEHDKLASFQETEQAE